ncbi:hypothetical protein E3P89_00106 [Wallemia ichthyophaga]|uniref:Methylated-DNA-[protein]-cysteine S-methyltransferase DNA binding domain-containing protein n=1 Tax=Wallemia ichthyophaga TaxID=245174 RepID=A0A4T0HQK3_WALIC|nr:hypothetical protein E3P90_00062 [Wallemia ichthyophaga]TIB18557.1 hypothetical protein E3P93_00062 [Wallemia ichthyophaga]TIB26281.1 hypothetical protein E3P89_00106 [Wallemia ichthyophaga]TIB27411.1 hypothetical protein E3P88_00062 [Wallemia ichthyophaga]
MDFHAGVYELVDAIPYGKVATYGQIAKELGQPNHSRMVGQALKLLNPANNIPWHRVINSKEVMAVLGSTTKHSVLKKKA